MEKLVVQATIEEKTNEKKGTKYVAVQLPLSSTYTATLFLSSAEQEIFRKSDLINSSDISKVDSTDKSPFEF